jgi:hypothetical protein
MVVAAKVAKFGRKSRSCHQLAYSKIIHLMQATGLVVNRTGKLQFVGQAAGRNFLQLIRYHQELQAVIQTIHLPASCLRTLHLQ